MKKLINTLIITIVLLLSTSMMLFANGTNETSQAKDSKDTKATIIVATYGTIYPRVLEQLKINEKFKQLYPNVEIELEEFKSSEDYSKNMKIRASANQLPDIMFSKPFNLVENSEFLLPLEDDLSDVIDDNIIAEQYKVNGHIYAIPTAMSTNILLYWPELLEKAGCEVPKTWPQYLDVLKKCQDFYGADNKDFAALSLGAKDEWPTFPYTEFGPLANSGNGNLWNDITAVDAPFAEGQPLNDAYKKAYELFVSGVCGRDPLGISVDQSCSLFESKQAVFTNAGSIARFERDLNGNTEGLKAMFTPFRMSEDEPLNVTAQGDDMISVTTSSKHPDIAKDFVRFYMSEAFYYDLLTEMNNQSCSKSFTTDLGDVMNSANDEDVNYIVYQPMEGDYNKIASYVKFNTKKEGCRMFMSDYDFDVEMNKLNDAWTEARSNYEISK